MKMIKNIDGKLGQFISNKNLGNRIYGLIVTVILGYKNCQDENQLDFMNQIKNEKLSELSLRIVKIRTNLTLGAKIAQESFQLSKPSLTVSA